jgi:hypothetical protein
LKPIRLATKPKTPPTLATVRVDPASLFRVSGHNTGEPYFGKHGGNRFDDPVMDGAARYGTCYFGTSFAVAVAETLLHDRKPQRGFFIVERSIIMSRYLIEFAGNTLVLANLTGAELKRMGGHAGLSGTDRYSTTKKWSSEIHRHPDQVDGLIYMSRHKNDERAVVIFDRAAHKVCMTSATRLSAHPDFGQTAADLYIRSSRPPVSS